MRSSVIAVFDSGVGGLSILSEIQKKLPHYSYSYFMDSAFFPYGTKCGSFLKQRLLQILPDFVERVGAEVLVIACNTASTLALEELRKKIHIPIVGVVPAIKPAAESSQSKVIGLLATPATIERPYTQKLIEDFASEVSVVKVGSQKLVKMAEDKVLGRDFDFAEMSNELSPLFLEEHLDTIVLACTHFDHLRAAFSKAAPKPYQWLSSAHAVASRVESFAKDKEAASMENILHINSDFLMPKTLFKTLQDSYRFAKVEYFCR